MDCYIIYEAECNRVKDRLTAWRNLSKECKEVIPKPKRYKTTPYKRKKRAYKADCWAITEDNAANLPNIELRGFKSHHIDHIVPIHIGFKLGIPLELIGSIDNLVIIPAKDNLDKGISITKAAQALVDSWTY